MTVSDTLHYLVIGNPVCKTIIGGTSAVLGSTFKSLKGNGHSSLGSGKITSDTSAMISKDFNLWKMVGNNRNFIRLAGLSGATAIILAAYGGHRFQVPEKADYKNSFDIANRFHFFCSLALMGIPMARQPKLSGSLMILGTIMFCGPIYYRAFTGEKIPYAFVTPFGGICLVAAWLSLML